MMLIDIRYIAIFSTLSYILEQTLTSLKLAELPICPS